METPENTPKKSSGPPNGNFGTPNQPTEREKNGQTPQTPNRAIGSLVLLTQKFVDLMIRNGGEIDLKDVSLCWGNLSRCVVWHCPNMRKSVNDKTTTTANNN